MELFTCLRKNLRISQTLFSRNLLKHNYNSNNRSTSNKQRAHKAHNLQYLTTTLHTSIEQAEEERRLAEARTLVLSVDNRFACGKLKICRFVQVQSHLANLTPPTSLRPPPISVSICEARVGNFCHSLCKLRVHLALARRGPMDENVLCALDSQSELKSARHQLA